MSQMDNARPRAGSGTGAKTAGEDVTASVTDHPDKPQRAVPVWMRRRGGDLVTTRRRHCRAFDRWALDFYGDELCARYGITPTARNPEPYAAGGMTLDVAARERAA